MIKNLTSILSLILIAVIFVQCTFLETFQRERYREQEARELAKKHYGEEIELYYGGHTVGLAFVEQRKVVYAEDDYEIQYTIREEITYKHKRFRFVFVLSNVITEIQMLRYANNSDSLFRPVDSYAVVNSPGGVYHKYFGLDGETILSEKDITEPHIVEQIRELFRFCDEYLGSYFMMMEDKKARALRRNRIQSLGYELLQFDRI